MAVEFDKLKEGWLISPEELENKGRCDFCSKKIDHTNCYRCEITKKLFCAECNPQVKMVNCGSHSDAEHEHNHIVGVSE